MTSHPLKHVAIIMDGNSRWAKQRGKLTASGHRAGVERIRDVLAEARRHHVEVVTLYAFSSENWRRPPKEVDTLMSLFLSYLKKEAKKLNDEGVSLRVIGNLSRFSPKIQSAIEEAQAIAQGDQQTLVIAADYGGRWDIAQAAQQLAQQAVDGVIQPDDITETLLDQHTCLSDLPPLDLLIRTGGDQRISNFLLWQCAYAELYFTDTYWPDFDETAFAQAVADFQRRQRRFGGRLDETAESASGVVSA